jgi:hypothetical protein
MTEQPNETTATCPSWCRSAAERGAGAPDASEIHAHVSEDIEVGDPADPMTARMIQLPGSDLVRVAVGQQVLGVEEAEAFARALIRLTTSVQLAEAGFGFVETLAVQAGVSTGEIALASGLDVDRVRAQRAGGQVLNTREFDRLALAVAQLLPLASIQD